MYNAIKMNGVKTDKGYLQCGSVNVFINNHYNTDNVGSIEKRTKQADNKEFEVFNVVGSVQLDEYEVKKLTYAYSDILKDSGVSINAKDYLQIKVSLMDTQAKRFASLNPVKEDVFEFYSNGIYLNIFDKKDGSKGVELLVRNVHSLEPRKTKNVSTTYTKSEGSNESYTSAPAPNQAQYQAPAASAYDESEFEPFDVDDDDLPF